MFQSDLFPAGEQMPAVPLAFAIGARIAALLTSGRHLTRAGISGLFAEETGVLDWGGAWTIDDYNNAVEMARRQRHPGSWSHEPHQSGLGPVVPPGHHRCEGRAPIHLDYCAKARCFGSAYARPAPDGRTEPVRPGRQS